MKHTISPKDFTDHEAEILLASGVYAGISKQLVMVVKPMDVKELKFVVKTSQYANPWIVKHTGNNIFKAIMVYNDL